MDHIGKALEGVEPTTPELQPVEHEWWNGRAFLTRSCFAIVHQIVGIVAVWGMWPFLEWTKVLDTNPDPRAWRQRDENDWKTSLLAGSYDPPPTALVYHNLL